MAGPAHDAVFIVALAVTMLIFFTCCILCIHCSYNDHEDDDGEINTLGTDSECSSVQTI